MVDDEAFAAREVALRAELAGLTIRPEDIAAVVQAWRLIELHLARVNAAVLTPEAEPASLFRP